MNFYSYTNKNRSYTQAISLKNVRTVRIINGDGKSAIRFSVRIDYIDTHAEFFHWLEQDEAEKVYEKILNLLNKEG